MIIKKRVQGHDIELELKRVKTYPHGYTLYDVCKDGKFLYRTCFTSFQLKELRKNGGLIGEDELPVVENNSLEEDIILCM